METKVKQVNMRVVPAYGKMALDISLFLGQRTDKYWPMTATTEFALALAHALVATGQMDKALEMSSVYQTLVTDLSALGPNFEWNIASDGKE